MTQTSNVVQQSVNLADELKINLEYDIDQHLLNVFVQNISDSGKLPSQINVLSKQSNEYELISKCKNNLLTPTETQQGLCT